MPARFSDLVSKLWRQSLGALHQPSSIPWLAWSIVGHRAHAGEIIHLTPFRAWWRNLGIRSILDVGAHSGEFASAAARLMPNARILSFEPQRDCFDALNRRMRRCRGFASHNVALGATPETSLLHRSHFSKASSLLSMADLHVEEFPWTAESHLEEVAVERLDDIVSPDWIVDHCLLKIDVQGYELRVLEGAVHTLDRVRVVLVETGIASLYAGDATFDDVYGFLTERGFCYAGSVDQLMSRRDGRPLQQDSVFQKDT